MAKFLGKGEELGASGRALIDIPLHLPKIENAIEVFGSSRVNKTRMATTTMGLCESE